MYKALVKVVVVRSPFFRSRLDGVCASHSDLTFSFYTTWLLVVAVVVDLFFRYLFYHLKMLNVSVCVEKCFSC